MATNDKRPVMDEGEPYRRRPYTAGGPQGDLAGRKNALMNTGTIGYLPGHEGQGPGSFVQSGHVHEVPHAAGPVAGFDDLEYAANPRPHPREIPVHSQESHFGNVTRYLDGHSEVVRERPGLVAELNDPETHPADKAWIKDEIARRDAVHLHRYW